MELEVHAVFLEAHVVVAHAFVVFAHKASGEQRRASLLEIVRRNHEVDVAVGAQGRVGIEHACGGSLEDDRLDASFGQHMERLILHVKQVCEQNTALEVEVGPLRDQCLVFAGISQATRHKSQARNRLLLQLGIYSRRVEPLRQRNALTARIRRANYLANGLIQRQSSVSYARMQIQDESIPAPHLLSMERFHVNK